MVRLVRANLPGLPALTLRTCKYASRFVCTICADLEKFIYQDFGHYMFFHRRGPIFRGFQPRLHVPASTPQGSEQLCITPKQAVLLQLPAVFNKCRGAYTKVSEQLCITPKQAVQCLVRSPPSTTEVEGCIYQGFCITGTFVIECSCWYKVQGTRYQVQGTRYKVPGTRYKVQGT